MDRVLNAPVRLALFCAALGVVLGAVTLGPLDVLTAGPAMLAAFAVLLAAALVGRGLGQPSVVHGRQAQHEAANEGFDETAERHGAAGSQSGEG
jgi:hypothetical protein